MSTHVSCAQSLYLWHCVQPSSKVLPQRTHSVSWPFVNLWMLHFVFIFLFLLLILFCWLLRFSLQSIFEGWRYQNLAVLCSSWKRHKTFLRCTRKRGQFFEELIYSIATGRWLLVAAIWWQRYYSGKWLISNISNSWWVQCEKRKKLKFRIKNTVNICFRNVDIND